MSIFVFDLETTGLPEKKGDLVERHKNCRIVQIAYRIFDKDGNELKNYEAVVKPDGYTIENDSIHGTTNEFALAEGVQREELFQILEEDLKGVGLIVGHNITFDVYTLAAEFLLYEKETLAEKILVTPRECTMMISMKKYGFPKFPKLTYLYRVVFDKDFEGAHTAMGDCTATAEIYFQIRG